jgi:hypothetical protein
MSSIQERCGRSRAIRIEAQAKRLGERRPAYSQCAGHQSHWPACGDQTQRPTIDWWYRTALVHPRTWASVVIHVLGQLNFLSDPSFEPVMTTSQVAAGFGVGQSTVFAKTKVISAALGTHRMEPQWTLRSLVDSNPLTWMAQVNGLLVDLRTVPREVQQIAFDKGIIPYIPADKKSE